MRFPRLVVPVAAGFIIGVRRGNNLARVSIDTQPAKVDSVVGVAFNKLNFFGLQIQFEERL